MNKLPPTKNVSSLSLHSTQHHTNWSLSTVSKYCIRWENNLPIYNALSVNCVRSESSSDDLKSTRILVSLKSLCSNNARVTTPNLSRIGPNKGFDARTTTAFCTVDRVTSSSLASRSEDLICRLHDIPKRVVGWGEEGTRWK